MSPILCSDWQERQESSGIARPQRTAPVARLIISRSTILDRLRSVLPRAKHELLQKSLGDVGNVGLRAVWVGEYASSRDPFFSAVRSARTPATRLEIPAVRGIVVDSRGQALPSAVVYLCDHRTKMVRTHHADHNGRYRFSALNPYDDSPFTPKTTA